MKSRLSGKPSAHKLTSRRYALGALGTLLFAPFIPPAAAQQSQLIRVGLQNSLNGATAVVWARQKIYANRGLKIETFNFADGRGVRDAMLAGKVDVGTMNLTPFLAGAATGSFTLLSFAQLGGDTVGVLARPNIKDVADLKGKNFSITIGSTTGGIFLHKVAPALGLKEGDYRVINLPPENQVPALAAGSIDAFAGPEPYVTIGEEQKIGRVLMRFGKYDPIPTCLVASTSYVESQPEMVTAFLKSWLDGLKYWESNPDAAADSLLDMYRETGYTALDRTAMRKLLGFVTVTPDITPDLVAYMKEQADVLYKAGSLKRLPDWDKIVRSDLLAKARA
jgi:NitT/TauT family transport system substrate-binding protein